MEASRPAGAFLALEDVGGIFAGIDQCICLCEIVLDAEGRPVDYVFLEANALFERLTGLKDAVGRRALDLVPDLEPFWVESYGRVALERVPARFCNHSNSLGRTYWVYAAPVEPHGRFAIVFRDVTEQERIKDERAVALERAEALLQELNHRVMNSLGMIAAIIKLEARSREEGEGRRALDRIGTRVHAVGDLYRTLNAAQHVSAVRADEYLCEVLARLEESLAEDRVRLDAGIEPLVLTTAMAAPLGLMVNELVTNSLKYAFPRGRQGRVVVTLARDGRHARLVVADDGRGMAAHRSAGGGRSLAAAPFAGDGGDMAAAPLAGDGGDLAAAPSAGDAAGMEVACPAGGAAGMEARSRDTGIGRKLVAAFAQQLGGTVTTEAGPAGTSVVVVFPLADET